MPEDPASEMYSILRSVGLHAHWTEHGFDAQAHAWIEATSQPQDLTSDQWVMLRTAASVWDGSPGPNLHELLSTSSPVLLRAGLILVGYASGGEQGMAQLL